MVFNNPVMDKCYTITRKVGVSVQRRGLSVRRPTGLRNTTETRNRVLRIRILKRLHFACIFVQLKRMVLVDQGHASRIITSVLKPPKPLQ